MERSSIIAHRGLWFTKSQRNSDDALVQALNEGFGIETDLRDLDGSVVISHDPPSLSSQLSHFEWLLEQIQASPSSGRIALNIKSDGLSNIISSHFNAIEFDTNQCFVFDMSVPDSLLYFKKRIPVYTRISEYETISHFLGCSDGVWVDNFTGSFSQVETAKDLIQKGTRATIVSSELHQRNHETLWNNIVDARLHLSPLFELCTDYPMEAFQFFATSEKL